VNARGVEDKHAKPGAMQRLLDGIERVGNKVPHPALIFLALIVIVIVLSQILSWAGTSVTTEIAEPGTAQVAPEYPGGTSVPGNDAPPAPPVPDFEVRHETITAESLLTGDGIRIGVDGDVRRQVQQCPAAAGLAGIDTRAGPSRKVGPSCGLRRRTRCEEHDTENHRDCGGQLRHARAATTLDDSKVS